MRYSKFNSARQALSSNRDQHRRLRWVERLSILMDSRFRIGGFRFGLDPLLNLIPFAGQITAWVISMVLVMIMARHGASGKLVMRMVLNVAWDAFLGSLPLFGQVFDFFNKANQRNVRLLKEHYRDDKHQGSARPIILTLCLGAVLLISGFIFVLYKLSVWTIGYLF